MKNRRGSALLIVLGFLSFMVVSAVAFSIYMRSERVPSSVFRRNVAVRHLVKAGLAHAISEIDDAIRSDPFPGVTSDNSLRANRNLPNGNVHYADTWFGRVFMPPHPDDAENDSYMAPEGETVAVLNLEGLGYVPPPLVNDVRFLSRRSWAAKWRNFDYGAGRFAYCAVNVSDYFDINRVAVGGARSSGERVSLSSLFADGKYDSDSAGVSDAGTFRTFVATRGGTQGTWPFVSMLDYALAMRSGAGGFESPFYRWVGRTSSGTMYENSTDDAQNQVFVTDSWMPDAPNDQLAQTAIIDLNNRGDGGNQDPSSSGQPFPKDWMQDGNSKTFQQVRNANSQFAWRVGSGRLPQGSTLSGQQNKSLLPVDYALLKDYLDRDDTPISLALPCAERVPMVAALGVNNLTVNLGLVGTLREVEGGMVGANAKEVQRFTDYKLNPSTFTPNNQVTAAVVFPFKRAREINQTFKAKALLRVFLVEDGSAGLRVNNSSAMAALRPSQDADWNESKLFQLSGMSAAVPPFVVSMVSDEKIINTAEDDILEQADVAIGREAGHSVVFRFEPPADFANAVVLTKKEIAYKSTDGGVTPLPSPPPAQYALNVSPFAADGSLVETAAEHWMDETAFASSIGGRNFRLQAAVWIYIEAPNGDVVELVPAIAQDDLLYNDVDNSMVTMEGYDGYNSAGTPLFRFRSMSPAVAYNVASESPLTIPAAGWEPGAYCAVDPRFNWAPEDWLPRNDAVTGDKWVDWVTGRSADNGTDSLLAADGRDSDIFMFVSNQGFLQSMGELAFLPAVTDFGNQAAQGAMSPSDLLKAACVGGYNGAERTTSASWTDLPCANLFWRTYRPYRSASDADNSQHLLDFRNFYGGGTPSESAAFKNFGAHGVRVNPYTDSEGILMTAFAYTPYDWWAAAGTNTLWTSANSKDSEGARRSKFNNLSQSRKYTFHENSNEAKMKSDEVKAVGKAICNAIRSNAARDWKLSYDALDWYGNATVNPDDENSYRDFMGANNLEEPLHGVDRKFLYAFWRDCLANRQQLFLVFVRAESMALGGSGQGQIPPQQGGRAVALVWRDPNAPTGGNDTGDANGRKPHRTRILFYHQFD